MNIRALTATVLSITLGCLLSVRSAEPAAPAQMQLTIPCRASAPKLDGALAAGEWDDAAVVSGMVNQLDGTADRRQASFWIKADAENVYIAQRSTVQPREWAPKSPPIWFDKGDSSFVIGLGPGRVNRGDEPSHYLLRVNLHGQRMASEITWRVHGVRLLFPHPSWKTNATVASSFNADQTEWTSEVAIPLADMKVDRIADGETWPVFFARDYEAADPSAATVSADWRFGNGRGRHYGRVFFNHYRLEQDWAVGRFVEQGPVVQSLPAGPDAGLLVLNASAAPARLAARMELAPAGREASVLRQDLSIEPGKREQVRFDGARLPDTPYTLRLSVEDAAGATVFARRLACRAASEKTETPLPDFSMTGYHKGGGLLLPSDAELRQYGIYSEKTGKETTIMATCYDPVTSDFYARLDLSTLPDPKQAARADVAVSKDGALVTIQPVRDFRTGQTDQRVRFHLADPAPGVYQAVATVYDERGEALARARQVFIRYDHARDLPWLGSDVGRSRRLLPPWTPMVGRLEGRTLTVSCWGRDHVVDGSGLFTSVAALSQSGLGEAARELLAGPVHFELIAAGQPVPLRPGAQADAANITDTAVLWRGSVSGGGWRIETAVDMDYDGYALHRVRIIPPAGKADAENPAPRADRLRLVIPLIPTEATHLHAIGGDWFRSSVSSIALPADPGLVWHSGQKHGLGIAPNPAPFGRLMTVGNFRPYVWIGGANRGLAFMADSDEGWVPDDAGKVPSIEVVRGPAPADAHGAVREQVALVLNLVARPFTFGRPRAVTFSLQATPVRPLTPDFRQRLERLSLQTCFPGFDSDGWDWNGCRFQLDDQRLADGHGSQPYPLNWDRNIKKRTEWERRRTDFTPYQSQLNLMTYAEVEDPRMPAGLQASNVYGYLYPHIAAGCLEHGNLSITRPDLEYRLWCYRAWIARGGLKGVYFDQTEPILGANPSAGCGYVLDLPDRPKLHGRIQPGYLLTNVRDFYKRLRTLFVEAGVHEPMIWLHTTDANTVSAFAFTGAFLEGENLPYLTAAYPWFSQKYTPERMQAVGNPAGKWGIGTVWLSMFESSRSGWSRETKYAVMRSLQGYSRVHDIADQWSYLKWAPLDPGRLIAFHPYWDPAVSAALKTNSPDVLSSAYFQDNRLLVFVFNRDKAARDGAQVMVDTAALGLRVGAGETVGVTDLAGWECKDALPMAWESAGTTGLLTLTIPPHDYRILLIETRQPELK